MNDISCREANIDDLMLYFKWANDATVRQNAISSEPISLDNHKKWYLSKMKNTNNFMYLFEYEGTPFGQVRFDIEQQTATIDYAIDADYRGKGLGKQILKIAIDAFINEVEKPAVKKIQGIVKVENIPSAKIFKSLDFFENKIKKINEPKSMYYTFVFHVGTQEK